MATTPKGIYYPNDYNEIADIPEDMKKMAESIDEVFEDTDSDLSDIKEEQTTQNNRLNSLETDNTTNKSNISSNTQEINNIKQEQTTQNTNISNNATNIESLQEENDNLKKIVSQLPQVEGQGTEVTLENTIEAPFTIFDVEGNSTQDGTPSPDNEVPIKSAGDNENLFDKDNEEQFLQNLTPDNNGLIVSAQTSTTSPNYIRTIIIPCKSDANYAITRFLGGKTFFIYESDEYPTLNKQTTLLKRNNDAGKASEIIKTSATAKYLLVKIYNTYASEYYTYDELISRIKIEQGNKASGYSPYGMGSINEKINNKNFAWNNLGNTTLSGVTFTVNENKSITANGTATRDIYYVLRNDVNFKTGETWTLSGCTGGSSTTYRLYCYNVGDLYNGSISHTFQGNYPNRQLGIAIKSGTTLNNVTFYPQLELNSQATDYVPPQEQDYSIFVQQPMRSIRDVRDCFVKKSDGKLYERHLPYIASYNGETLPQDVYNEVDNVKYCNEKSMSTTGQFSIGASVQYIDENNWNDLPCTPEQIQQLENKPSTYKDFTIIQSEDETPAYLEVSGIYDLNKLITRTEVLESEV